MNRKVVTNLRIPEDRYLMVKSAAAEMGISINEYVNRIISAAPIVAQFGRPKKTKKNIYDALAEISKKVAGDKPMGLSDEDEIIYG